MDDDKKSPGRPFAVKFRAVKYVQLHDAFTPLQLAPIMSLGTAGSKAMKGLEERANGIAVDHPSGRQFVVPYGNISFYELDNEK